ncbi:MAG: hypothetical protein ABJO02_15510 [Reichenbachiella sp.]|uniref:hypothetical protein n=1 Tax=Reichenbachiella sp. TaxID=2184521 RepID=UPI003296F247
MRKSFFFFFILSISHLTFAQNLLYQVEINDHRAGSLRQSVEADQNTHTFSSLDFQILSLNDTLQYFSEVHFVESDSGYLKSVEWTQVFKDTLNFTLTFSKDTLAYGPEKIRKLSIKRLDTIGASICYPTYSPELNQTIEVSRELVRFSIEKAQKLRVVKETIGTKSTINKFDNQFYLVESKSPSPFGEIRLIRTNKTAPPQFFEHNYFKQGMILSNIRFPDPNSINTIKLKIEGVDSLSSATFKHYNQKITLRDSNSLILIVEQKKEPYLDSNTTNRPLSQLLWSGAKARVILDSLGIDTLQIHNKIERIKSFSKIQSHPNLALLELSSEANIPARMVCGYVYNQWFWSERHWAEMATDGYWEIADLSTGAPPNPVLRIAIHKSKPGGPFNDFVLKRIPKITSLQVQSFTLRGKKHAVSSQVLPYYFENPVYENEGLGIRMNIPDGFAITNDGTLSPSDLFLSLENDYKEKINCFQLSTSGQPLTPDLVKEKIQEFVGAKDINISQGKKFKFWYGHKGKRGAIVIPQGGSYILITIEHEDPEFMILVLSRKNLTLKY